MSNDAAITLELQLVDPNISLEIEPPAFLTVADKLSTPRKIKITGSADGEATFDGTADAIIHTSVSTLSNEELEDLLQ